MGTAVCIAAAVVGGMGLLIGVLLVTADKVLSVPTDELTEKIRDVLPGNNCGGCGYAGCDALAEAIAKGEADPTSCPVGGQAVAALVCELTGKKAEFTRMSAYVRCAGTCEKSRHIYEYFGDEDCRRVTMVPGRGTKACSYGCLGFGSCVKSCDYDAIHIVEGVAVVDKEKCTACGKCVDACPQNLIEMVPYTAQYAVTCLSQERGKSVKDTCEAGCIGCGLCARSCPVDAVTIKNNIAHIDQTLCTNCGACMEKCPTKVIRKR